MEKLGKAGVGFVSIQNDMDYTTPTGKFMLVMQGGLAELYSDNLSEETKKGMRERKLQGLYCGHLPFGVMKGDDGVPVPNPQTHPGVLKAFQLEDEGKSDLEVAQALNTHAYRTASPGNKPFTSHSVRGLMSNRFYLGELPGGWLPGKHEPLVDSDLWERAKSVRDRRRHFTDSSRPLTKRLWSFTGLVHCWRCKVRIHSSNIYNGEPRMGWLHSDSHRRLHT
ncbi:MAG: recombinase family protein [Chloroflexi bacterium]|nr:recombinase family protein [Chloroflexota bacterium]